MGGDKLGLAPALSAVAGSRCEALMLAQEGMRVGDVCSSASFGHIALTVWLLREGQRAQEAANRGDGWRRGQHGAEGASTLAAPSADRFGLPFVLVAVRGRFA